MRVVSETAPGSTSHAVVPGHLLATFAILAVFGLFTANPLLTAASILTVPLLMWLLWRPSEPPVLLLALGFQWIQVTAKVFHANVEGVPVVAVAESFLVERAIWLGLAGLVVLAVGCHIGMRTIRRRDPQLLQKEVEALSIHRVFLLYLGLTVLASFIEGIAWALAGLTQPLMAFTAIKWVGFFLLGYIVLYRRSNYYYLVLAVLIEFVSGIGFFSEFKTVFFVAILVIFSVHQSFTGKNTALAALVLVFLLVTGAIWTNVKEDFRYFLNEGERTQHVTVDRADQLPELIDLVSRQSPSMIVQGLEPMFERLAYVDFFSLAMEYVPSARPHEGGALWASSVQHVLVPRLLNPDKPRLPSDSELTMTYTGLILASEEEGTSISIGYMGESYIDFGARGMFVPILILGMLWGFIYAYFVGRSQVVIFGFALAVPVLLGAYQFEMAGIKLLGGILMNFIVFALVMRFGERPAADWLRSPEHRESIKPKAARDNLQLGPHVGLLLPLIKGDEK